MAAPYKTVLFYFGTADAINVTEILITINCNIMNNLTDLLEHEVKDLYSAEKQLLEALPKMEAGAHRDELKNAFREHLEETKGHVNRLAAVADSLGIDPTGEECNAMKGLIAEGSEILSKDASPDVKDAALIAAAQRVEHYEIAAYGSASCFAHCTDNSEVKKLLDETLEEEKEADSKLNKIATGGTFGSGINKDSVAKN